MNISRTNVTITPHGCETTLPGGDVVPACPHDTDSYRAQALALGYGTDTLRMCREHEIAHSLLASWLGLPESPTLRAVFNESGATEITNHEEAAVLAVQRFATSVGVSIQGGWGSRNERAGGEKQTHTPESPRWRYQEVPQVAHVRAAKPPMLLLRSAHGRNGA